MKEKIDRLEFKVKNSDLWNVDFLLERENTKRIKGPAADWDKIFLNHLSNKGLISRIYNELLQLNNKKTV